MTPDGNVVRFPGRPVGNPPAALLREAAGLYKLGERLSWAGRVDLFDHHIIGTIDDVEARLGEGVESAAEGEDLVDYAIGWIHLLAGVVLDMHGAQTVSNADAAQLFALSACPAHRTAACDFTGGAARLRALVEGGAAAWEDLEQSGRSGFRAFSRISRFRLPDLNAIWRTGDVHANSLSRVFTGACDPVQLKADATAGRYTGDAETWVDRAIAKGREPKLILIGDRARLQMSLLRVGDCDDDGWLNPDLGFAAFREVAKLLIVRRRAVRIEPTAGESWPDMPA